MLVPPNFATAIFTRLLRYEDSTIAEEKVRVEEDFELKCFMNLIRLGTMPLEEAKTLQRILASRQVDAQLDHNAHTCTRGCTVTVEMLVPENSIPIVQDVMKEQYQKLTTGLKVDWNLLTEVFDPSKDSATCPACGTQFSTQASECPDCGLCF